MNFKSLLNKSFWLFIVLFLTGCGHKPNELQQAGLKGNVKSLREITYLAFGDKNTVVKGEIVYSQDIKNYFATYNKDGNMTQIINYDNENSVIDKWIFRYNDRGVALGGNYYSSDNSLLDSTTYIYDKNGNIEEYYHYFHDGRLRSRIISQYDGKGNITTEKLYDSDNLLYRTTKCFYKKNNLISDSVFDSENNLIYYSTYIYDNDDNLITQTIYNSDGHINSQGSYTYNASQDVIQSKTSVPNQESVVYSYTYKYDDKGNWIEKITFINNKTAYLTIRQLEYF